MVALLRDNPLLLLFVVAAGGYVVGRLKVLGFSLGVAAVLFVGLAVGSIDASVKLPEIVYQFGLVLFVYTVGLSSGPGFFASFRRRGVRDNAFAVALLVASALVAVGLGALLHLRPPFVAGLFAGASTNTPALASILEVLKARGETGGPDPVVAYSLAYPIGVLGVLGAMVVAQRWMHVDYAKERVSLVPGAEVGKPLANVTVRVDPGPLAGKRAGAIREALGGHLLFGRMKRGAVTRIVTDDTVLEAGDLVTIVGTASDLDGAAKKLGASSDDRLDLDRHVVDFRRIFVSSAEVTEKPLSELRLTERFGAIVTRIRRGDAEILPDATTELELGDRVRVVATRERMEEVAKFFGDSYRALSEIDVITFSVGIGLGLLVGAIGVPLPGGATFKLGAAGGPLLVGLWLGRVGRTKSLVWTLPYSANLTLRQLGLVLFLAGVGTRSGYAFVATVAQGGALPIILAGAAITLGAALTALVVGHKLLGIPMGVLVGMLAGIQTQPAALAFACEQTKSELPNVGYASVYPVATIAKILIAQVLLALLR